MRKRKIKYKTLEIIILSAGYRQAIKSFEPISTMMVGHKTLLQTQIDILKERFKNCNITVVSGYKSNSVYTIHDGQVKFVENVLYRDSNSGESLRLAINNSSFSNILFIHGDLLFTPELFNDLKDKYFLESFVVTDRTNFENKEVGVNYAEALNIMSYSLPEKWAQIAYLTNQEVEIMKSILRRDDFDKYSLTFELINKVIDDGGAFKTYENTSCIKEIDSVKTIRAIGVI